MRVQPISYFSDADVEVIMDQVFAMLEKKGVKCGYHKEVFDKFKAAGARIDDGGEVVYFPKKLVQECFASAPRVHTLGARNPARVVDLPHPEGLALARTGPGGIGYLNPDGYYEKITTDAQRRHIKVTNTLDNINMYMNMFPGDRPAVTADIHSVAQCFQETDKHVLVQAYSAESIDYIVELATAVAGSTAALKKAPVCSMIVPLLSPGCLKTMDLEILYKAAMSGIPATVCPMPACGTTAPGTMLATVVQCLYEAFACVTIGQLCNPGAPVQVGAMLFAVNMTNGSNLDNSAEAVMGQVAVNEVIKKATGLPTHNNGFGSDTAGCGSQGAAETTLLSTVQALGYNDMNGGAGHTQTLNAASALRLMLDNEILGMLHVIQRGFEINEDTLAWDEMFNVEFGGHFVTSEHTLRHCRDNIDPIGFVRQDYTAWVAGGKKDLFDLYHEQYDKIMAADNECLMAEDQAKDLQQIVDAADKALL